MILLTEFRRGPRCEHDEHRECTVCFMGQMRAAYAAVVGDDFETAWQHRNAARGPEDQVESFSCYVDGRPS